MLAESRFGFMLTLNGVFCLPAMPLKIKIAYFAEKESARTPELSLPYSKNFPGFFGFYVFSQI